MESLVLVLVYLSAPICATVLLCCRSFFLPESIATCEEAQMYIANKQGWKPEDFYLTFNGRKMLKANEQLLPLCTVRAGIRLLGGKGGFGSMLRAIGARIEKTTNHEACRDLSGRRMRDVNNEKNITEWLREKETKDEERVRKRQEKLERILNPKVTYEDTSYTSNLQQNASNIDEALKHALKNRNDKPGAKRKGDAENGTLNKKKSKLAWMGMDDEVSADGKSDEEINEINDNASLDASNMTNPHSQPTEDRSRMSLVMSMDKKDENLADILKTKPQTQRSSSDLKTSIENTCLLSTEPEHLDLSEYHSPEQVEAVGLERLKSALMYHGLKCGGTLQERAKRLFLTKTTPLTELDPSLFAKVSKKNKKKQPTEK